MRIIIFNVIFFLLSAVLTPGAAAAEPDCSAASAILVHADTGAVLYEQNADEQSLIASTTKIMTAVLVLEKCSMDDPVRITGESAGTEGSSMYLKAGESYTVGELLYGMMLTSGNDAACALAIHAAGSMEDFAELMNEKAAELGMDSTCFKNPHGLDAEGHFSTARDMARLGVYAMENDELRSIASTRSRTVGGQTLVNHNKLLWSCEGCLGLKTGYTKAAGRSLVSCVEREGMRLVCVTLGDPDDWDDHTRLYDWAFENWSWAPVELDEPPLTLPVISGESARVSVYPAKGAMVLRKAGEEPELRLELPRFVFAPVEKGAPAGRAVYLHGGGVIGGGELVYGESVSIKEGVELTPWERFKRVWAMAGKACGPYYLSGDRR